MPFWPYQPAWPPCAGRSLPGTRNLMTAINTRFEHSMDYGIYSCRPSSSDSNTPSIHSDGRAGDTGFPDARTGARTVTVPHPEGTVLCGVLIAHAWELGIHGIIWNRIRYDARSPWGRIYTGPVPHIDHVHWEQTSLHANSLSLNRAFQLIVIGADMAFTVEEEAALRRIAPYVDTLADLARGLLDMGTTTGKRGNGKSLIHVLESYRVAADNAGIDPTDHVRMGQLLGQ